MCRVLGALATNLFVALVDALQKTAVINIKEGNLLLLGRTRETQVRDLLGNLQQCSPTDCEKFIKLLCWKKETFTLGCQIAWRYKQCKNYVPPKPVEAAPQPVLLQPTLMMSEPSSGTI